MRGEHIVQNVFSTDLHIKFMNGRKPNVIPKVKMSINLLNGPDNDMNIHRKVWWRCDKMLCVCVCARTLPRIDKPI